ncbi:MAG: DHHW family protein [Coriobacteriaceae bacterium]|nr:DHHW family protein [Coriobacteriaceae bacterium]
MQKIRNIVLLVCASGLLCCTMGFKVLNKLNIPVPSAFQTNVERSYLEGRPYTRLPSPSVDSFLSGDFQDNLESYTADALPLRETLLLGKASLQRLSISEMAALLGYDAYHTFFGSGYLHETEGNRLLAAPARQSKKVLNGLVASVDSINDFVASNPGYTYYFAMPYRSDVLGIGPLAGLVSEPLDAEFLQSRIFSRLSPDITQIDLMPSSYEEFKEDYFKTDHHWNIKGAYKAYCIINEAMGNASSTLPCGELLMFPTAQFYGSEARSGLDTSVGPDMIEDYEFALPHYETWIYGELMPNDFAASTQAYIDGFQPDNPFVNLYADYWHADYGQIVFVNQDNKASKNLLIVADSFSNPMERMFLSSYSRVYVYDPRYATISLADFLKKYDDIDDILFCETYQTMRYGKAITPGGAAL